MRFLLRIAFGFGLLALLASDLHAQSFRTFVASYGNDANDGSRATPKRNFQAAHDAVATNGQIVVLDSSGYGPLNITKSISVIVPPGVNGFVTVTGNSNGINIGVGSSGVVTLRGLIIEGGGLGGGSRGIAVSSVGDLNIEDCTVRNFERGISVISTTDAQVYLYNTSVRRCSFGFDMESNGANVDVIATATRCRIEQCTNSGAFTFINVAGGTSDLTLADCDLAGNSSAVVSQGATSLIRVDNCRVVGNSVGAISLSTGQILSRGNNTLEKNNSGNTNFPGAYSAK